MRAAQCSWRRGMAGMSRFEAELQDNILNVILALAANQVVIVTFIFRKNVALLRDPSRRIQGTAGDVNHRLIVLPEGRSRIWFPKN